MTWLQAKTNPATQRANELDERIGNLRSQIDRLNNARERNDPDRIRTILDEEKQQEFDCDTVAADLELDTPAHYNEMGVRKFNLEHACPRFKNWLVGAPATNEKFNNLFPAANHDHLPPLRRETRIARNRFILAAIILLAVIWTVATLLIPKL